MNRITKYLITIAFAIQCLLCGSINVSAQTNADQSLLYSITTTAGTKSHIFGTIHIGDSATFMQRDTVLYLLDRAAVACFELDLDSIGSSFNPTALLLPEGQKLSDFYTEEEYAEILGVAKEKVGPLASMINTMKPAAVAALLMIDLEGGERLQSVDEFLWQRARRTGISCRGLETVDEQMDALSQMPPHFLLDAIRAIDSEGDDDLEVMLQAYQQENLPEIAALVDSVSGVEGYMATLNDNRNIVMVERLKPLLEQGDVFVAVGTAHFTGPKGLLRLLREHGYIVEPVTGGRKVQWLRYPTTVDR